MLNIHMRTEQPYHSQDMDVYNECITHDSYRTKEPELAQRIREAKWIVDIGAHIGCFSVLCHSVNPDALYSCAECCPENLPYLRRNVGSFAWIHRQAITYENNPILLNSIFPGGSATGGSMVVNPETTYIDWQTHLYQRDNRLLRLMTLDTLINLDESSPGCPIDILKLDCEGSEISIMENSKYIHSRVKFIVGEWHTRDRFFQMIQVLYRDWEMRIWHDHQIGTFWMRNPNLA